MRQKKSNKNIKLKTLLHNQSNILSICKSSRVSETTSCSTPFDFSCLKKGDTTVHVKYHIYSKLRHIFDSYVPVMDRARHIYSLRNCTSLGKDIVATNKAIHRQLALADCSRAKEWKEQTDIQVVINNSIDRSNVDNCELAKTYDEMYLGNYLFENVVQALISEKRMC